MIRRVLLVSENPELHSHLLRDLAAHQIQVAKQPSLRAAASLLSDQELATLLVLDVQLLSRRDAELVAGIEAENPQVKIMLFTSRPHGQEALHRLQGSSEAEIYSVPLADPTAFAAILNAVSNRMSPAPSSLISQTYIHPEPVRRTRKEPAADPLYSEEFLRRVGLSDVPVLLHGETGSGKEVMARKLWSYSNRVGKPFLKLNCAALPSELVESELFGYEKGAFTGAMMDKPGKFEMAQDGTILLDEIGDMDTQLQAKLLQVLQDGEVQPLGSSRSIKVNVRIMAATHRDLTAAIANGTFREDLYYRLSVINLTIPPLRDRRNEILSLAEQLLSRHASPGSQVPLIPESLQRVLLEHRWPGNVRELENVMRRFLVYQDADLLAAELSERNESPKPRLTVAKPAMTAPAAQETGRVSFDRFAEASRSAESKLLLETLESVRWNRRQAAEQLNIDYKALLYKLQKHGIVESKSKRREASA
jgi:DNA-binding NtrC family response regulator